jgi:hypothetical protein
MKNIIKTGAILLTIAAMNTFVACEKEIVRDPSPEASPNSNHVYFPDQVSEAVIGIEDSSYTIAIAREVSDNALSVALTISGDEAFSIPKTVSFDAGDADTTFTLSIGEIELMKNYQVILTIDESQTNPYDSETGIPILSLNVVKEDFVPYAEGLYTCYFLELQWETTLEYSSSTELYRFSDLWYESANALGEAGFSASTGYDVLFKWTGTEVAIQGTLNTDGTNIYLPTGFALGDYGMVSAYYSQADINYYDEATKTFIFPIEWRVSAGTFGKYPNIFEITEIK